MTRAMPQATVKLEPFDPSNFPIAWKWLDDAWEMIADQSHPRDIDSFIAIKEMQGAVNVGVLHEGDLCGLLTLLPVSDIECQGHCVFRRHALRPEETIEAIRQGVKVAWSWGYSRMWMTVFPENRAMIRVLRQMGANYEGRAIARFRKNGQPRDCLNFSFICP